MLYALLTTISAIHPTTTPIPIPIPIVDAISGWEKADVIGSLALGGAALDRVQ
jgi:hypothetical protein